MQIRSIVSESLQASVRRLLPSQQGFTEDLQATNVITPVIDLTRTAEGSQLPLDLSSAVSFDSNTNVTAYNSSIVIANTPGFYKFSGSVVITNTGSTSHNILITFENGATVKNFYNSGALAGVTQNEYINMQFFLDTGDIVKLVSNGLNAFCDGIVRQTADRYGNIVNPVGFTFE